MLVVDDEEDLREILKFNLESEGYLVDTAPSAEEALKMLTEEYDLILLDVMMGGMSGFKMAEKLRKDLHNSTPIIFLTAKDTENDMLTGFNIGGDDYISKPFSIKEVSARVKAVLKRAGSLNAANKKQVIDIGEMHIDLSTKCVSIHDRLNPIVVKCSNRDAGKLARQMCQVSCIACGLCVRNCPNEAIFLKDGRVFAHRSVEELRETEGMSVDAYFREVFKC